MEWELFLESKDNEFVDFFTKRKEGAKKIVHQTAGKDEAKILTNWHFSAKDKIYRELIQAIKSNRPETYYRSKWTTLLNKLRTCKMKQKEFQKTIGELEVLGEVISEMFN